MFRVAFRFDRSAIEPRNQETGMPTLLSGYPILSGVHYITAPMTPVGRSPMSSQKSMTTLSPVEASTLSLLARHHNLSRKEFTELLNEASLSIQARRIAEELYANGKRKPKQRLKKRSSIARKTAQQIRSWADVNERVARAGPLVKYQRPVVSSDEERPT
jgi:hypothetical protein